MINIRRVIEYTWQILKAQGGHYPQIENMIRQAELDVQHYEWLLSSAQQSVNLTALRRWLIASLLCNLFLLLMWALSIFGGG